MQPSQQNSKYLLKIALGIIVVLMIILCILLVQEYRHIRQLDYIANRQSLFRSLRGSGQITAAYASSTQAWMTFDYINHVFALPPQYLQTTLAISDNRYPRVTIAEYAADNGLEKSAVLRLVQEMIRAFFIAKLSQPPSPISSPTI